VTTPQKAPNKANLESKEGQESQELKSETAGAEGRKQSQSSQGGDDQKAEVARWPTGSAEWPAAGGRWPVKPQAASCFMRRSRKGPPTVSRYRKVGSPFRSAPSSSSLAGPGRDVIPLNHSKREKTERNSTSGTNRR
jgi:hypothetical protein